MVSTGARASVPVGARARKKGEKRKKEERRKKKEEKNSQQSESQPAIRESEAREVRGRRGSELKEENEPPACASRGRAAGMHAAEQRKAKRARDATSSA